MSEQIGLGEEQCGNCIAYDHEGICSNILSRYYGQELYHFDTCDKFSPYATKEKEEKDVKP